MERYPTEGDTTAPAPLGEARYRIAAIVAACTAGASVLDPASELDAALMVMLAEIAGFAGAALAFIDQAASETVW